MRKFTFFLMVFGLAAIYTASVYAQCNIPSPPGTDCNNAPVLCDQSLLDGYCSDNPPIANSNCIPQFQQGCATSPDNVQWIGFIASSTSMDLRIMVSNCLGSNNPPGGGIQAQVFSAAGQCGPYQAVSQCYSQGVPNDTFILNATNMLPCQLHYLQVDGWTFDQCHWEVEIIGGPTSPPMPSNPCPIMGPALVCPGIFSYSVSPPAPGECQAIHDWEVVNGTILSVPPFSNQITVQWDPGFNTGQVIYTPEFACNLTAPPCTLDVTEDEIPIIELDTTVCEFDIFTWQCHPTAIPVPIFNPGIYTCSHQTSGGCTQEYQLEVFWAPSTSGIIDTTICEDACIFIPIGTNLVEFCGSSPVNNVPFILPGANAQGCDSTVYVTVSAESVIASTIDSSGNCGGGGQGKITVITESGTLPFSYQWSDDPTINDPVRENLDPGIYTVTVSSALGCSIVLEDTIFSSPPMMFTIDSTQNINCNGDSSGAIFTTIDGGSAPYTYTWDPDIGNVEDPTGLWADTFSVTITDAANCTAVQSAIITEPPALVLTDTITHVLCNGNSTAVIDLTVNGGTGTKTYTWDPSSIGNVQDAINIPAGNYAVTVTDQNNCSITGTYTITEPDSIEITGTSVAASCGADNGSIDITVTGGVSPYTYDWNDPADDVEDPQNLGPGSYTVVVTDDNGCTETFTIAITTPSGLEASAVATPASCFGASDGAIDLTINGGLPPYTITWSDTTLNGIEDPMSIPAGSYTATIMDQDSCTVVAGAVISQPDTLTAEGTSTEATCGEANGSITLVINGGTPGYTITWNDPTLNGIQNPTGLAVGTYIAMVTDTNNCTDIDTIVVSTPNALGATAVVTDVLCNGDSTGAIDVTITGGTTPFILTWNAIQFNGMEDISNVPAGNYILTILDANDCEVIIDETITEPAELMASISATDALCNGDSSGTMDLSVTGGTPPYSYDWSDDNWDGTEDPNAVPAGFYTVTITDSVGCTTTATANIGEPSALTLSGLPVPAVCGNANGSIDLAVGGGTPGYTFTWSDPSLNGIEDPTGLLPGIYYVTITDTNNCVIIDSFDVSEPDALMASAVVTDVDCNGDSTGAVDVSVMGGTAPYSYTWHTGATSQDLIAIPAGNYQVEVMDQDSCTFMLSEMVAEPELLQVTTVATNANCFDAADGAIDVTVTGGVPPYTFTWSDPSLNGMEDPTGLTQNTYIVTVTNANDCIAIAVDSVAQPEELLISDTSQNILCNSDNTGAIDLTITGGTLPYQYDWDDNTLDGMEDPVNLTAGTYIVVVTDVNDCSATHTVTLTEPDALAMDTTVTDAVCADSETGAIDLTISGGVTPYSVVWNSGQMTEDLANIPAGNYQPMITDDNGCILTGPIIVVEEPEALGASGTSTDASCGESNGTIDLTVTGGIPPYSYMWSSGLPSIEDPQNVAAGNYFVTVTDANDCTLETSVSVTTPNELLVTEGTSPTGCFGGSDGSISLEITGGIPPFTMVWSGPTAIPNNAEDPTGLSAGTYNVTVTDADTCDFIIQGIMVDQPTAISIVPSSDKATCGLANGSIDLQVSGGTMPYNYTWTGPTAIPNGTQDPANLLTGDYTVTVTDANNCTDSATVNVPTPNALSLAITTTDVDCNGGSDGTANVTVNGGISPFDFTWSNSAFNGQQNPTNMPADIYTVTVTDADGCTITIMDTINEPTAITANAVPTDANCFNGDDGSIDLTVSGGTPSYTYAWNNGAGNSEDPTNLAANTYTVIITDANGCTHTVGATIDEPAEISLSSTTDATSCFGYSDGSIDLTVNGGTGPYNYQWTGGADPVQDPANLSAGPYSVIVTDNNGCTATLQDEVMQPAGMSMDINLSQFGNFNVSCFNTTDGSATAEVNGGTPPYAYNWSTNGTGQMESNLAPGNYSVVVTDNNGCTIEGTTELTAPEPMDGQLSSVPTNCFGSSDGAVFIDNIDGGIPPFSYSLDGGTFGPVPAFGFLQAGVYAVEVQDAAGCIWDTEIIVDQPVELVVELGEDVTIELGDDLTLNALVNDPFSLADVVWEGFIDTSGCIGADCLQKMVMPAITTPYTITVTDTNGCVATDRMRVIVEKPRRIYVPTAFSPNDDGHNDFFGISAGRGVSHIQSFFVFDRWGEMVHEIYNFAPNDPAARWDGSYKAKDLDPAVFIYYAEVVFDDGEVIQYKGDVTLVR